MDVILQCLKTALPQVAVQVQSEKVDGSNNAVRFIKTPPFQGALIKGVPLQYCRM